MKQPRGRTRHAFLSSTRHALLISSIAFIWVWAQPLRAEINTASTVEWLTCESEIVAVGKLTTVTATRGPEEVVYEDCVLSVSEAIKGTTAEKLMFCCRHLTGDPPEWLQAKGELLVFLSVCKEPYSELHLRNVLVPVRKDQPPPVFDLSKLKKHMYSKDMKTLTEPAEVLKIARAWATSTVSHSLWAKVPFDSPIFRDLYAGSSCFLIVPAEEKFRAHFMELAVSKKPREREEGAAELSKYPGPDTEKVLRGLLEDNTENFTYFAADTIYSVEFSVRTAAYRSLLALGVAVVPVQTERKPTVEERRACREKYWRDAFNHALTDGWTVLSVEDGVTRQIAGENRETTTVTVNCGKGDDRAMFVLIPKEWNGQDWPGLKALESLGNNGFNSQGARYYYLGGTAMPTVVKEKVIKYFGLQKSY